MTWGPQSKKKREKSKNAYRWESEVKGERINGTQESIDGKAQDKVD